MRSFEPLPNMRTVFEVKSISFNLREQISEILAPVAKRSSIIAVLRRVVSFSYFVVAEHILL